LLIPLMGTAESGVRLDLTGVSDNSKARDQCTFLSNLCDKKLDL
jgi:hypothetical protein